MTDARMTKEEMLRDIRATLKACIRAGYEEVGVPFTEADLNVAEYEILKALAGGSLGGGPMVMGEPGA